MNFPYSREENFYYQIYIICMYRHYGHRCHTVIFRPYITVYIARCIYRPVQEYEKWEKGASIFVVDSPEIYSFQLCIYFTFLFFIYWLYIKSVHHFVIRINGITFRLRGVYLLTCAVVVGRLVGIFFLLRHQELHHNSVLISVVLICMSKLFTYKFTYLSPFLL